ncbi:CD1375 family protein [Chengkuizengella axinellae]|uniref:CD1375 family protein n=1 Tax=Chengkuizengella axinellae TaxID=3064388 RepID=A0ABT9J0W2_9BACL|nr:CD1375 family protein [Chengkuizengella sp. 2205SS18-9]MDP5275266.1 CD1375 family protein [Chengkuizengella sp. 2205SS18-9]
MWGDIYYKLVKEGRRTIDQVPEHLKEEVQTKLDADNDVT